MALAIPFKKRPADVFGIWLVLRHQPNVVVGHWSIKKQKRKVEYIMAKTKDNRFRNFMTEVYVESAPEDWLKKVSDLHTPGFISPIHDKDVYEEDALDGSYKKGDTKKPHYHLMFMFEGKKSIEMVSELFKYFGGVGCFKVNSIRAYARYLCHLDNPEKVLYDIADVTSFGGADYLAVIDLPEEKYKHISEMMFFCVEHEVYSFAELSMYAMVHRQDWFRILVDKNTHFIKEFLKGRQWEVTDCRYKKRIDDFGNPMFVEVDPQTGEVIDEC